MYFYIHLFFEPVKMLNKENLFRAWAVKCPEQVFRFTPIRLVTSCILKQRPL